METLELKHIAPYLPYDLTFQREMGMDYKARILIMIGLSENMIEHSDIGYNGFPEYYTNIDSKFIKPILYPLTWLTKEIEHNGEKFMPFEKFEHPVKGIIHQLQRDELECENVEYYIVNLLIKWHFNVFNISKHLYIDKSTLKDNGNK